MKKKTQRSVRELMIAIHGMTNPIINLMQNHIADLEERLKEGDNRDTLDYRKSLLKEYESVMAALPKPPREPLPQDHAHFIAAISA